VRAPELTGSGGWIHTTEPITLAGLRGRVVLLDFWTSGCVNCLHVLEELRTLEARWARELVVLGVHSPKFAHEADHDALAAAAARHGVHHPVLDDPELRTWDAYNVKAWPTLVLVDPQGYVVHVAAGEGHAVTGGAIARVLAEVVADATARGTLRTGDGPYRAPATTGTPLRFPSAALATPTGTVLVSDTGHHQVVELEADWVTELRRWGSGTRGAPFTEPAGMTMLPAAVAAAVGYDVVLADTAGHQLHGLSLATGTSRVVAGTGSQWRHGASSDGPAAATALTSPWDVEWWPALGEVVVAMAGNHTLSALDPAATTVRRLAGTTVEGLLDGPLTEAFLAQPSGLAADGDRLWFVDAETSALRWLEAGRVHTAIGTGLFDFGHRDGPAEQALLQHPLGVAVLADGSVAVADTYNRAVRRYDPAAGLLSTLARDVAEPNDVLVLGGELLVVASAGHEVHALPTRSELVDGSAPPAVRPTSELSPGPARLSVVLTPAPGTHLDEREGPATRLEVSATPPALLVEGAGTAPGLVRALVLAPGADGVLHVRARAVTCDTGVENPVCQVVRQEWRVPVRLVEDGPRTLDLVMGGPVGPEPPGKESLTVA
jgi:thiol-disulfide isomerase/thioredoxin